MTITGLLKKGKYVHIQFDDYENIKLSYEIVLKYALSKNDDLDIKKFEEIQNEDAKFRAKQSAYRILTRRAHSEKELRDKLIRKEYSSDIVHSVINELYVGNYLDDTKFAEKYITEKSARRKSPLKIKSDLILKGISATEAEKALKKFYSPEILKENIKKHIAQKRSQLKEKKLPDTELINKILISLQYKGFPRDKIFKYLNDEEND